MKQIKIILLFLFVSLIFWGKDITLLAQNMVPNPSFESHTVCPANQSQWYYAVPWDTVPSQWSLSSPDYFNSCSPTNANPNGQGTPKNAVGFQVPLTGDAYMGIFGYLKNPANGREYILTKLLCPLQNGKIYKAGFFVSRANVSRYAIDQMGMYIGDTIHGNGLSHVLNAYTPQIKNNTGVFLEDTVNWMEITGTFTAQGNEKYIAIGNFATDANTIVKDSVGPLTFTAAYYLIDSVYLIPTSPQITLSADTAICKGSSVTLQAGGSSVYYWFNSANMLDTLGTASALAVSPTISTTYVLHTCCGTPYPVHVQVAINPPVAFSLGKDTLLCVHDTLMLTAPSGYTYQWQDGNSHSAITVTQAGTYWVDVSNACGTTSDTINASYSDCTGVQDIFSNGGLSIFPNPSRGMFNVQWIMDNGNTSAVNHQPSTIEVSNMFGEKVYSTSTISHQPLTIDLSSQANGVYLVRISNGENAVYRKISLAR